MQVIDRLPTFFFTIDDETIARIVDFKVARDPVGGCKEGVDQARVTG